MSEAKILATAKALPAFSRSTEKILPYMEDWLEGKDKRFKEKAMRIFKYAEVETRYSIMDVNEVFTETSFEEKNAFYAQEMTKLAEQALLEALKKAHLEPGDLDMIITTSCTGIMIPAVDAHLINNLRLKRDILRLPVTEMGCAGGTSALIYAQHLLGANPGKRAAIIALESPTSTFQHRDVSMTNVVSAAIFGDGVACTIMGPAPDEVRPVIVASGMYHFYDALHMMGFDLKNTGLQMVLDPSVPEVIKEHFPRIIYDFLAQQQLSIDEVQHFIFHPGGKKIVQLVEEILHSMNRHIEETKQVLKHYGNMSSATVLYVLEAYLEKEIRAGERGLMLSFGPGFSAQRLLLEWR
jgi:predicted naringenin-chalcone synthase